MKYDLGEFKGVKNIINDKWTSIPNQFIIYFEYGTVFQSYNSIIAIKYNDGKTIIGKNYKYSKTTGKYRNIYLNETLKKTDMKIKYKVYTYDAELV